MTEMVRIIISSFWEENQENLLASIKKGCFAVMTSWRTATMAGRPLRTLFEPGPLMEGDHGQGEMGDYAGWNQQGDFLLRKRTAPGPQTARQGGSRRA